MTCTLITSPIRPAALAPASVAAFTAATSPVTNAVTMPEPTLSQPRNSTFAAFIIASLAGFALTGVQSVSRSMVGLLSPPGRSGEFYGFFAVAGRSSSFIGPTLFGVLAAGLAGRFVAQGQSEQLAEQMGHWIAIFSIIAFLAVGLVLLLLVDETKGREASGQVEKSPAGSPAG